MSPSPACVEIGDVAHKLPRTLRLHQLGADFLGQHRQPEWAFAA